MILEERKWRTLLMALLANGASYRLSGRALGGGERGWELCGKRDGRSGRTWRDGGASRGVVRYGGVTGRGQEG